MNNYKYFSDVLKNGYFTETPCQFCGSSEHCLEGSFFDRDDNLVSICLNCFDKRKVSVDIPNYIADRVVKKQNEKVTELSFCPPVYNVPLVKTQMKKIIVTAKTLYSHPKNVSKIYAALHTDLAW